MNLLSPTHTRAYSAAFITIALSAGLLTSSVAQARGHHSHHSGRRHNSDSAILADFRHHRAASHVRREEDAVSDGPLSSAASLAPYLTGAYPQPHSRYCALMDVNSGKILFARNSDTRREPASLTKIMAATILLENGNLADTVVAPMLVKDVPESSLHLRPGEQLSLQDLLYAMLLRSANDTPIAGATYLSGSVPKFVDLMNAKAAEIGCVNTHFVTPNGLYDPNHYSTAHDLGLMARYAIQHEPEFNTIVKTQRYTVTRSMDTGDRLVVNTASSFLKYFPGADGIKTGFISQAGHCFVGSATRGGWRLVAVALDSSSCREDVESMLSYGFAHFQPDVVVEKGTPEGELKLPGTSLVAPVETATDLNDVLSKDHSPAAQPSYTTGVAPLPSSSIKLPIRAGDRVGTVSLYADGKLVGTADAVASAAVAPPPLTANMSQALPLGGLGKITGAAAGWTIGLATLAFAALKLYAGANTKGSRRRRSRIASQMRAVD